MSTELRGNKIVLPIEVQTTAIEVLNELQNKLNSMEAQADKIMNTVDRGTAGGTANANSLQNVFNPVTGNNPSQNALDIETNKAISEALEDALEGDNNIMNSSIRGWLSDNGVNDEGLTQLFSMIRNPQGFFQTFFTRALPILGVIYTAKEIAEFLFDELTARGRLFDLTFRRIINEEILKLRSRELKQQVRVGERQVIFVSEAGKMNPVQVTNSFELVRNGDIFASDAWKVRKGYQF